MADVLIVIPARFASSRFPGKPLAVVAGSPMVLHALETARRATCGATVVVATDDERIAAVVREAGGEVVMTSPSAPSGSDRVWEVAAVRPADIVVNLQVDEPMLPGSVLDALVDRLVARPAAGPVVGPVVDPVVDIATPAVGIPRGAALPTDVVTIARGDDGTALYFSRSVIPWGAETVLRHIGVYAYRWDALRRYVAAGPTGLEATERLEQLRALALGLRIGVVEVDVVTHAVDRPEDVAAVERLLRPGAPPTIAGIRLVVLDVDGVLTDGRISYLGDGAQLVSFDAKDGEGVKALKRAGIDVAIVTARDSAALRHRAAELGIAELRTLVADKAAEVARLATHLDLDLARICYVGDDVGDLAAMALCGMSAAPADATDAARRQATIVLGHRGGRGAVRELSDLLVAATQLPATQLPATQLPATQLPATQLPATELLAAAEPTMAIRPVPAPSSPSSVP